MEIITLLVSVFALAVSALTAWATLLRRGKVEITPPTVIYFGPDGGASLPGNAPQKVFLRFLIFSTGKRGQVIENMYIRLRRNESVQNFSIWVKGDKDLTRGSGLFVSETGFETNHHFLMPKDGSRFSFHAGVYEITLFAKVLGEGSPRQLWKDSVTLSAIQADAIQKQSGGVYFDFGPDTNGYIASVSSTKRPEIDGLISILTNTEKTN